MINVLGGIRDTAKDKKKTNDKSKKMQSTETILN